MTVKIFSYSSQDTQRIPPLLSACDGCGSKGAQPSPLFVLVPILLLQDRFTRQMKATVLPKRRDAPGQINPGYQEKLVELHGAVLGVTAMFVDRHRT